jgi:hypothetical protein
VWNNSSSITIVNYVFLASIVVEKIEARDVTISDIEMRISAAQKDLLEKSNTQIETQRLDIGKYSIQHPYVDCDLEYIFSKKVDCLCVFPGFEEAGWTNHSSGWPDQECGARP